MKRILFLFLIGLSCNLVFAQDIIFKHNGDEIKSKIIEITDETIKYKEFEFQDGPIRNIKITDVFMVIYENGRREKYTAIEPQTSTEKKTSTEKPTSTEKKTSEEVPKSVPPRKSYKGNYFSIGTGYGNSYGGIGVRVQGRFGGNQGFGVHGGVGYFPGAPVLGAAGLKFFPYKDIYINAQFGFSGVESGYYYWDDYYNDYYSRVLFGPALMTGVDMTWGRKVGFGFNAGIGASYFINARYQEIWLATDLGFIIRF